MDKGELRSQFPELSEKVYGRPLVYLDNAATAQRPFSVIRKWEELSSRCNANLHRAVHHIAEVATDEFEKTRDSVRNYINAAEREEIVFTSGATASVNLAAFSFGEAFVREGDEVIVTCTEHHSDFVPWQMMCGRKGARLRMLECDESGHLRIDRLREMLNPRTRIVCITHISNVLGLINPVKEIVNICHSIGCKVFIDGAQGIVHSRVDVRDIGCDFYAFSGHKVYAAPGTGVLYARRELLESMPPYMGGGEMVGTVSLARTTFAPLPYKFEAGTQNMAGIPTLMPAFDMAREMEKENISSEYAGIRDYILDALTSDPDIRLYGLPGEGFEKTALFSFSVKGIHHEDLALILDKMGIAVRSGQMCAEPLMDRFGVTGMLRASFAPYNTMREAEYFIESLYKAVKMLR